MERCWTKRILRTGRKVVGFALLLCVTGFPPIGHGHELPEGVWSGRYTDHTGESFKIKYTITSQTVEDQKTYTIKMNFLSTENVEDEILKNFSIKKNTLSFTMGEGEEIETCTLKRKEDKERYTGHCQSSLDKDGEKLSTISMVPPQNTSSD